MVEKNDQPGETALSSGKGTALYSRVQDVFKPKKILKLIQKQEETSLAVSSSLRIALDILESLGVAGLLLDMTGRVVSVNPALEKMTGFFSNRMIGQSARRIFSSILLQQEEYSAFEKALTDVLGGQLRTLPPATLMRRNDFPPITLIPSMRYITDDDGKPTAIIITLQDISESKEAHILLQKSERKYRELVENANSIILRLSPDHKVTFFNEYAQKFFGYTAQEILGKNVVGTIVSALDSTGRDLEEMIQNVLTDPDSYASNENENICKDGRKVWVHWANQAIRDDNGNVVEVLCVGTDITEKKMAQLAVDAYQTELRNFSLRLTLSEEQARRKLAVVLHDTVGQTLALTKLKLGALGRMITGKKEKAALIEIREMFDEVISQVRTLSFELSPPILYELGLGAAIEWIGEKFGDRYGFQVTFKGTGQKYAIAEEIRILFFESTRELLTNIAKHAEAANVQISLTEDNGWLNIEIVDDGKGIDSSHCKTGIAGETGFGLFSIRERMRQIGGTFKLQFRGEKGTAATLSAPMRETAGAGAAARR